MPSSGMSFFTFPIANKCFYLMTIKWFLLSWINLRSKSTKQRAENRKQSRKIYSKNDFTQAAYLLAWLSTSRSRMPIFLSPLLLVFYWIPQTVKSKGAFRGVRLQWPPTIHRLCPVVRISFARSQVNSTTEKRSRIWLLFFCYAGQNPKFSRSSPSHAFICIRTSLRVCLAINSQSFSHESPTLSCRIPAHYHFSRSSMQSF